jgi:alkaline phosphatase
MMQSIRLLLVGLFLAIPSRGLYAQVEDPIAALQVAAVKENYAAWGHWGPNEKKYSSWTTHSNRLIPVYTFGGDLKRVSGANSLYRDSAAIEKLYGYLPTDTVNLHADYCDQTDVYRLQKWAVEEGKKRIILFVFDGMDWHTTRAAAIARSGAVQYTEGRGTGLAFQDYRGALTDFGAFVTSPHNEGTNIDVNNQHVVNPGGKLLGGYNADLCGPAPWGPIKDPKYPIGTSELIKHAYTDSASSATSLTSGIKTYNDAINVDYNGREVLPIARTLQEQGFGVGVVTSVPISHATPACAYANNVHRDDYQDLTRDLIGRPSVFHPGGLVGVDVLIGCGYGESKEADAPQGKNFVPGNRYITADDLAAIDVRNGGQYAVVQRTAGKPGMESLALAAQNAASEKQRLFGYFGVAKGHLPFQTADGRFDPVISVGNESAARAEVYSPADLEENVNLSAMALAALDVLNARSDKWWLMVEAGDVDWANHSNNIDNSIGAVFSGDAAFSAVTQWIENHGGWNDTLLILTADHGHYLVLEQPEALAVNPRSSR